MLMIVFMFMIMIVIAIASVIVIMILITIMSVIVIVLVGVRFRTFLYNFNAFAHLPCGTPPTGGPFAGLWAERHAHSTGPATIPLMQNLPCRSSICWPLG